MVKKTGKVHSRLQTHSANAPTPPRVIAPIPPGVNSRAAASENAKAAAEPMAPKGTHIEKEPQTQTKTATAKAKDSKATATAARASKQAAAREKRWLPSWKHCNPSLITLSNTKPVRMS